ARSWIAETIGRGVRGKADLCAYFYLRAFDSLGSTGTIGLIATVTISQGATRAVGLDQMTSHGMQIFRAVSSRKWPTRAQVQYAVVWGTAKPSNGRIVLDGHEVGGISTLLEPGGSDADPFPLRGNSNRAYLGAK